MRPSRHTLCAAAILLILAAGFCALLLGDSLRAAVTGAEDFASLTETAEEAANDDLDRRHWFIQLYGGVQRLLGRSVVEDDSYTVVRLTDGSLSFLADEHDGALLSANAASTAALGDELAQLGIPYLFVMAPQKIWSEDQLPAGTGNSANQEGDQFLRELEGSSVEVLDLREWFQANGSSSDWFFRTDHHWTPQAAFAAFGVLAQVLERDFSISADPSLTDEASYVITVYEDIFLGSQGKRVGSLFAGTDDLAVYSPRFDTDLTYTTSSGAVRSGSFDVSVCFPERITQTDWFGGNPYTYYAGGDYALARVVNHLNGEGPKLLLLRDSFACALTPFLSLVCSELVTVDLRYYEGDLLELIQAEQPDLVITLYCVSSLWRGDLFR